MNNEDLLVLPGDVYGPEIMAEAVPSAGLPTTSSPGLRSVSLRRSRGRRLRNRYGTRWRMKTLGA